MTDERLTVTLELTSAQAESMMLRTAVMMSSVGEGFAECEWCGRYTYGAGLIPTAHRDDCVGVLLMAALRAEIGGADD